MSRLWAPTSAATPPRVTQLLLRRTCLVSDPLPKSAFRRTPISVSLKCSSFGTSSTDLGDWSTTHTTSALGCQTSVSNTSTVRGGSSSPSYRPTRARLDSSSSEVAKPDPASAPTLLQFGVGCPRTMVCCVPRTARRRGCLRTASAPDMPS